MWVTLSLPKDEYGNNFGVCVLEDTLDDIHHAEADAKKLLDCIPEYYLNRGRLITKVYIYLNNRSNIVNIFKNLYINIIII